MADLKNFEFADSPSGQDEDRERLEDGEHRLLVNVFEAEMDRSYEDRSSRLQELLSKVERILHAARLRSHAQPAVQQDAVEKVVVDALIEVWDAGVIRGQVMETRRAGHSPAYPVREKAHSLLKALGPLRDADQVEPVAKSEELERLIDLYDAATMSMMEIHADPGATGTAKRRSRDRVEETTNALRALCAAPPASPSWDRDKAREIVAAALYRAETRASPYGGGLNEADRVLDSLAALLATGPEKP